MGATAEPRGHSGTLHFELGAPVPDLVLYVRHERFQQEPALTFILERADGSSRSFPPLPLLGDLKAHAERYYADLQSLKRTPELAEDRLRRFGWDLWEQLIPADLRAVYLAERDVWRDKSMVVVSDEPYFPWELIWPYDEVAADPGPWCVTLRLTRWLARDLQGNGHQGPPARLSLRSLATLAPTNTKLVYAPQEQVLLSRLAGDRHLSDLSPELPTYPVTMALLEGGACDWVHVASHGKFDGETPDADMAIRLEGEDYLRPGDFTGPRIDGYLRQRRPGFVFNTCFSGRQGWALTRLGGWATRLIGKGAGLFIAPLWAVTDRLALQFSDGFYGALLSDGGMTVGEAVRRGREAARDGGDPTWLAYSVYAHPNARVVVGGSSRWRMGEWAR